tara:strand:+ start:859 stop:1671 length:813 start_codon:yes stop_codon:yes gene_type:complete
MASFEINQRNINTLIEISKMAGEAIMKIYETDFEVMVKGDESPLTEADLSSNKIICKSLREITPKIPILSEESSNISFTERSKWDEYWLIDPLDGTKEFIKRNGEFTVNIALIKDKTPILGIIFVPATAETYWGCSDFGSFYQENNVSEKISVSDNQGKSTKIVSSRSHVSPEMNGLLNEIGDYELINKGSSLKLCLVARGLADVYPRLGPTCEWDIAAGHAIVSNAGGVLLNINGEKIQYNKKEDYLNPYFIASSNKAIAKKCISLMNK